MKFKMFDIILSLAEAIDLISPELNNHHQKVSYLSYRLAEHLDMPLKERQAILTQGLLHDIGALSLEERLSLVEEEEASFNSHAFRGAKLLSGCRSMEWLTDGIKYHHVPWGYGSGLFYEDNPVPISSHILHISDRVCTAFNETNCILEGNVHEGNVLACIPKIINSIRARENEIFAPELVEAMTELGSKEFIWLELADRSPLKFLPDTVKDLPRLDLDEVLSISKIFSHVIDFRSHFTATHSAGVAGTAQKLAELAGMSGNESKMILIAGYLHDIGKLAVPNTVLQSPGKLDNNELSAMRAHTFYTYQLLNKIEGFSAINQWASFHHERLNGKGYPFHLKGEQIPLGSRIMTVADIFNAITENRPYRRGMEKREIINVFNSMIENGEVCSNVVDLLLDNLDLFINLCRDSQKRAAEEYQNFFLQEEKIQAVVI